MKKKNKNSISGGRILALLYLYTFKNYPIDKVYINWSFLSRKKNGVEKSKMRSLPNKKLFPLKIKFKILSIDLVITYLWLFPPRFRLYFYLWNNQCGRTDFSKYWHRVPQVPHSLYIKGEGPDIKEKKTSEVPTAIKLGRGGLKALMDFLKITFLRLSLFLYKSER